MIYLYYKQNYRYYKYINYIMSDDNILTRIIDGETIYECKLCNIVSNCKRVIKNHLNKKNKCNIKDTTECIYCKKKFRDKSNLERHQDKQKKCSLIVNSNIEKSENKIIENLELSKKILEQDEEIKRLKELREETNKNYKEHITEIYDTFFQSYINKFGNLDLMFFTSNFIKNNRYDTRVNEYKNFIINIFDKCRLETLEKILEDIENYKKEENFELLLKDYEKELELRIKNNDNKKIKYTALENQLKEISNFIKRNYEKET